MKTKAIKSFALLSVCLAVIVVARVQGNQEQESVADRLSTSQVRDYRTMFRVNEKPMDMVETTKIMCAAPSTVYGPHYDPGVVYYINEIARQGLVRYPGRKRFPVGSIIVKEKQERRTDDSVDIITVMKKVQPGTTEDSWEYKMYDTKKWTEIDPSSQKLGPIRTTCIDCHRRYEKNDYVSNEGIRLLLRK